MTTMQLVTEEMASAAAKWWADKLRESFSFDNGEQNDVVKSLAFMLASKKRKSITPDKINAFESALKDVLLENQACRVSVDYHPDLLLEEAAEKAGIDIDGALPVKTTLTFVDGQVKARCGYGAGVEVIFPEV